MSEPQLQFHFRDSNSCGAADELAQFLANELPDWQPRVEEQVLLGEARKTDPLTIIGTCTGEHGIGCGKLDFLIAEHGEAVSVMRRNQAGDRPR